MIDGGGHLILDALIVKILAPPPIHRIRTLPLPYLCSPRGLQFNGLDISQSDKSISIVDQEAFYDEILCTEQVNRDDQKAFYDEMMYIEQVPLRTMNPEARRTLCHET